MKKFNIGIILDGNRRWAKEKSLPSFVGHEKGVESLKKTIIHAKKRGVGMLTVFVFSTENWKRSKQEVEFLMNLIQKFFSSEFSSKNKKNYLFKEIKVKIVGDRSKISKKIKSLISEIEKETKDNKEMVLNVALSYGGRAEIVEAINSIIQEKSLTSKVNEKEFSKKLLVPDLDIVIRTGKEKRLSNFFIWQAAYAELFFLDKYWPDFNEKDFDDIVEEYNNRQRRFGK